MKTLCSIIAAVSFSSCMHLGMLGSHDTPGAGDGGAGRVEKEVVTDSSRAVVVVPPLEVGQESVIVLNLVQPVSGEPVAGANVSLNVRYRHQGEADSPHPPTRQSHEINFESEMNETEPGIFKKTFVPSVPGEHTFIVTVTRNANDGGSTTLEVSALVRGLGDNYQTGGMHGSTGISTVAIIAGVVMGGMMIVLWASRGHVF